VVFVGLVIVLGPLFGQVKFITALCIGGGFLAKIVNLLSIHFLFKET